ncbi:hypothetical protein ANANG_G00074140 [Anguilla anguilla]|uniref:Uncharacterized protein n=1 Tax=Anguilla anguilla TaxID=7936 RepID=A0A9D3MQX5_ANGAN|nr:hypothetical protein ANANG_G00074140 [Anguilla anguilla]
MAKTSSRPMYTPRFGSQLSLRSTRKHKLGEKSPLAAANAKLWPADREQTANSGMARRAKGMKAANAKLFSTTRKEGPVTIRSIPQQHPNTCPKTLTEKKDIPHREVSGHSNTQRESVGQIYTDAFSFSVPELETPSKPSAVKQAVLRTISKMLEENGAIRRRLTACREERRTGTEWISTL